MGSQTSLQLLGELSSQLLLCDSSNTGHLDSIAALLPRLQARCSEESWALIAEPACKIITSSEGSWSASEATLTTLVASLAEACEALDNHLCAVATSTPSSGAGDFRESDQPISLGLPSSKTDIPLPSSEQTRAPKNPSISCDDWGFDVEEMDSPDRIMSPNYPETSSGTETDSGTHSARQAPMADNTPRPLQRTPEQIDDILSFYSEVQEAIEQSEQILLSTRVSQLDSADVDALFRAFHGIKGIAGFVGMAQPTQLANAVESLLGVVRQGEMQADDDIIDLLLESSHRMQALVVLVRNALDGAFEVARDDTVDDLCLRINAASNGTDAQNPPSNESTPELRSRRESQSPVRTSLLNSELCFSDTEPQVERLAWRTLNSTLPADAIRCVSDKKPQVASSAANEMPIKSPIESIPQQAARSHEASLIPETLKVDLRRVDSLVEMVGEMVIVESMINGDEALRHVRSPTLANNLRLMAKITRDLQKQALQLRMVPVRALFTRSTRLIRELSKQTGKPLRLEAEGEATEMDRSIVDLLAEPLLHLIRNAVDHGIETPKQRREAGKPAEGTISVTARHEGSSLVVEVSDDGAGLDEEALVARARDRGLALESQSFGKTQIFELIFAPGFSTAKSVTDLSGRGVGMDVVRKNVKAMRGRIHIDSQLGKGTTFRLVLPLTLAIINGTLISCGGETYILPTLSIIESIQLQPSMVRNPAARGEILQLRGIPYPLYRLSNLLGIPDARELAGSAHAVLLETATTSIALMVDMVVSQQQIVIKSLARNVDSKIFSGAAILSDGTIGLILNVDEITTIADHDLERRCAGVA